VTYLGAIVNRMKPVMLDLRNSALVCNKSADFSVIARKEGCPFLQTTEGAISQVCNM
jgi:hypothetical protein